MSTTSLKLPDALKERIQHFAAENNVSAHAFMVSTLESEVERREVRAEFEASAEAAAADIDAGGPVYEAAEVRRYITAKLRARGTGLEVERPRAMQREAVKPAARKPAARRR